MSIAAVAGQVLLWMAVAAQLLCCIGAWWMVDVFDGLHYATAATTIGPMSLGVSAAIVGTGSFSTTVEVVVACAVLLVVSPILAHATARAARQLRYRDAGSEPEEREDVS